MDREQAAVLLESNSARERLDAARFFQRVATSDDLPLLRGRRAQESVVWIREALSHAIARAESGQTVDPGLSFPPAENETESLDRIYSAAIHDIADQLVHELRPLIGSARLHAEEELAELPESQTVRDLRRVARVLQAMDELVRAASVPALTEFNLPDVLTETVTGEADLGTEEVQFAGQDPFPVLADPVLLHLVFRNGVRNAVEAVRELDEAAREPVVVSWGATDMEYRLSILDRGPGVPDDTEALFRMGVTRKQESHGGMGLYLARRAALSLGGDVTLAPQQRRGAVFELRWPRRRD